MQHVQCSQPEPPGAWGQIGSDHPFGAVGCRPRRTIIGHQLHYLLYYHFLGSLPACCIHHRTKYIKAKKHNYTSESVFGICCQPCHHILQIHYSTDPTKNITSRQSHESPYLSEAERASIHKLSQRLEINSSQQHRIM